jgi:hypothetical protein
MLANEQNFTYQDLYQQSQYSLRTPISEFKPKA